jgi:hypothetical protein
MNVSATDDPIAADDDAAGATRATAPKTIPAMPVSFETLVGTEAEK